MKNVGKKTQYKMRRIYKSIRDKKITAVYFEMDYALVTNRANNVQRVNDATAELLKYKTNATDDDIVAWVSEAYKTIYGERCLKEFLQGFIKTYGQYSEKEINISGKTVSINDLQAGKKYQVVKISQQMKILDVKNLIYKNNFGRNYIFEDENYNISLSRNDLLSSHHILTI